jgi:hypothetical protein
MLLKDFSSPRNSVRVRRTKILIENEVVASRASFKLSFRPTSYLIAFLGYDPSKSDPRSKLHRYGIATIETSNFRILLWVRNVFGGAYKVY